MKTLKTLSLALLFSIGLGSSTLRSAGEITGSQIVQGARNIFAIIGLDSPDINLGEIYLPFVEERYKENEIYDQMDAMDYLKELLKDNGFTQPEAMRTVVRLIESASQEKVVSLPNESVARVANNNNNNNNNNNSNRANQIYGLAINNQRHATNNNNSRANQTMPENSSNNNNNNNHSSSQQRGVSVPRTSIIINNNNYNNVINNPLNSVINNLDSMIEELKERNRKIEDNVKQRQEMLEKLKSSTSNKSQEKPKSPQEIYNEKREFEVKKAIAEKMECPICFNILALEHGEISSVECKHVLCRDCKKAILGSPSKLCPICRGGMDKFFRN